MRIVNLQVENFKRIVVLDITPDGNIVELAGKNGHGKTSTLDAIWVALRGMSVAPVKPIRSGAEEARIRIDLGELIVTRTFKNKDGSVTSTLKVEKRDGIKFQSPQTVLDALIGQLSFDPLAFARLDAKGQFNTLRSFVPGVDFVAIDEANRQDFDRRTSLNRRAKEAKAAAEKIVIQKIANPLARIDESALIAKLDEAGKHNTEIEHRRARRVEVENKVGLLGRASERELAAIKEHEEAIKACRERFQSIEEERGREQARLDAAPPLPAPIDTAQVRQQIESAKRNNAGVDEIERGTADRARLLAEAQQHQIAADEITIAMDKREVEKREAVAKANLPIAGLGFGDNMITFNGEPFSQASDAEQLRASIAIAMAMNPKLRIIRVRDGSLLDDDSMRLIADAARDNDFQFWVERVDSSGTIGFVLEDGHLKQREQ